MLNRMQDVILIVSVDSNSVWHSTEASQVVLLLQHLQEHMPAQVISKPRDQAQRRTGQESKPGSMI